MSDRGESTARALLAPTLRRDPLAMAAIATVDGAEPLQGAELEWLLRHHSVQEVTDRRELDMREGFDRTLTAYSRLEVGTFCRQVPLALPPDVEQAARRFLLHRQVRDYYEQTYPLPLVQRFARRLELGIGPTVGERDERAAARLFDRFITIDRGFDDVNLRTFLWMLDDFSWGNVGLPQLLDLARDADAFAASLGKTDGRGVLDDAAAGLREYLTFCTRLHDLLERAGRGSELGRTFKHHYAYWFVQARAKVGENVGLLLEAVSRWSPESANDARRDQTARLRRIVDELLEPEAEPAALGA